MNKIYTIGESRVLREAYKLIMEDCLDKAVERVMQEDSDAEINAYIAYTKMYSGTVVTDIMISYDFGNSATIRHNIVNKLHTELADILEEEYNLVDYSNNKNDYDTSTKIYITSDDAWEEIGIDRMEVMINANTLWNRLTQK